MKIRSGLVSNSSSSSFIIAAKEELKRGQLEEVVLKALGVPTDSPLYGFSKSIASCLSAAVDDHYTAGELLEDWGDESTVKFSRYWPLIGKAINDGGFRHFYRGSASNESGDAAELALVDIGLEYAGENIVIEKEEGY
jgi:hypothetical protein